MALWGKSDAASNTPLFALSQVNLTANASNQTALYGNTTQGAFGNKAVGLFGLDAAELSTSNSSLADVFITFAGSGYLANTTVTIGGNATANAQANSSGKISNVNITAVGNSYSTAPSLTIAAPAAQTFNSNASITNATDSIALSPNPFVNGDLVTYTVAAGNTALTNLTSGSRYYVFGANSTALSLSIEKTGPAIDLTKGLTEAGHSITGQTATAAAVLSNVPGKGSAHPGWVLRTVGQGGRAGRVTYETLVAMSSVTDDGSDDTVLKDS